MKKTLLLTLIISLFFAVSCSKKTQQTQNSAQNGLKKAMKSVNKELAKEITDENFKVGKNVYSIKLKSVQTGKVVEFSQFKGKKILIDFWSSWCVPCIAMFPDLEKIKKEYEDKGGKVKVLTISLDPLVAKTKKIIQDKKVDFEVFKAPSTLADSGILMPYTLVVDENGKIVKATNGKHSFEELKKLLGLK